MNWWEEGPLLISAVQCKFGDDDLWTLEEYVAKSGFNTEQLFHLAGQGHMAYYDEALHGTKLDEYLVHSRALGIREIAYYNTHCLTPQLASAHPDWLLRQRDGSALPAYNIYSVCCVNSPWVERFLESIGKLCRHDIDGLFLDGPLMGESGCYCSTCRTLFAERLGKSIDDSTFNERLQFRTDSVTAFVQKTRDMVKGANPAVMLYLNNSALRPDVTGSNSRAVEPYVDMLGAEGGFVRSDNTTSLWSVGSKAKHLETIARGKPTVTFIIGNQSGTPYYMQTPAETTILHAQSFAHGANIWYGLCGSASIYKDSPGSEAAKAFNRFVTAHKTYYAKSKSCAKIALMWSQDTANHYAASVDESDFTGAAQTAKIARKGDHYAELMSFFDILSRAHVQFDLVDEVSLMEGIEQYGLLILPDCACMSDEVAAAVNRFVEAGGAVISTFDTGFYHADGTPSPSPKCGAVQGIAAVNGLVEYPSISNSYQKPTQLWLFEGVNAPVLPAPTLCLDVMPQQDAQVLSLALAPMSSVYTALPEKGVPAILENRFGKGSSVYFTGNFGMLYGIRALPEYSRMVGNIVRRFADPLIEVSGPGCVEAVLRRQEGRTILHLVNLTGAMNRPFTEMVPLAGLSITVRTDSTAKPFALRGNVTESFCGSGKLHLTLEKLQDFDLIVIPD